MKLLVALAALAWGGQFKQLAISLGEVRPSVNTRVNPGVHRPAAVPPAVASAISAGDARAFHAAALAHEYVPPASDDVQQALLREGADRAAADSAIGQLLAQAQAAGKRARSTKIDYAEFDRLVALTPRLSLNPFHDIEPKRRILQGAGYTHLRGPGTARVPIALADDIRVGRAFQNTYETSRRRR